MITLPLQLQKGRIGTDTDVKKSINAFLALLISSPKYGFVANPDFGFVFNNLRFEILNEGEGVVFNATPAEESVSNDEQRGLYEKKISGSSKNLNTFAAELNESIMHYETRLDNVSTTMTYVREEKMIYLTVKGVVRSTGEKYRYNTTIKIWN